MSRFTPGPWHVEEENGAYGVFSNEALLAITLPDDMQDKDAEKANAHLMATAPLLLKIIKEIKDHLDNNLIVTEEGLKINDSHLRESISTPIAPPDGHTPLITASPETTLDTPGTPFAAASIFCVSWLLTLEPYTCTVPLAGTSTTMLLMLAPIFKRAAWTFFSSAS